MLPLKDTDRIPQPLFRDGIFLMAYNFAKRLKTLKGLTPYEYICKTWTTEPDRFRVNPLHHTLGLNVNI